MKPTWCIFWFSPVVRVPSQGGCICEETTDMWETHHKGGRGRFQQWDTRETVIALGRGPFLAEFTFSVLSKCQGVSAFGLPNQDSPGKTGGGRVYPQWKSHVPGSKEGLGGLQGRKGIGGQTVQGTWRVTE